MTAPVGPRVSKEEFMHALGLDANNAAHDPFYRAMRVRTLSLILPGLGQF